MSSYTIQLTIRNGTADALSVVEKTCWHYANGGTWAESSANQHVLTMGGSGTSGMLRMQASSGETFAVVLGVHNYKGWCGLQVDLGPADTALKMHPEYYGGGKYAGEASTGVISRTAGGKEIGIVFQKEDGQVLEAELTYYAARDERVY